MRWLFSLARELGNWAPFSHLSLILPSYAHFFKPSLQFGNLINSLNQLVEIILQFAKLISLHTASQNITHSILQTLNLIYGFISSSDCSWP
ncbi:hypothetical protein HanIR_Chr16g0826931 [Helianthus annuus]|nr:hypothetical protein HanIR_Chr16g0826931 [Helianthus annuus]